MFFPPLLNYISNILLSVCVYRKGNYAGHKAAGREKRVFWGLEIRGKLEGLSIATLSKEMENQAINSLFSHLPSEQSSNPVPRHVDLEQRDLQSATPPALLCSPADTVNRTVLVK